VRIKRNATYSLKKYGAGYQMIRFRISWQGHRIDLASGYRITDPAYWNPVAQRVRTDYPGEPGGPSVERINWGLDRLDAEVSTAFAYFERQGVIPTPEEFRSRLSSQIPSAPAAPEMDLFASLDRFVRESTAKNGWSEATRRKFKNLRDDLSAFRPALQFSDLTESGLLDLVCFWRDRRNLTNPTIDKKLSFLRWFLNWATDRGLNRTLDYRTFRTASKHPGKKVIYLTRDELMLLYKYRIPPRYRYLEKVRDLLFFCCFSGLRHSDAVNLRRSDVRKGCIEVTTVKTSDNLTIELNRATRYILEKYKDAGFPDDRALPYVCNQTMNRNLKTLCRLAGIDEPVRQTVYRGSRRIDTVRPKYELIGTHTGRRTFIVQSLSLGVPPNVVMKWTGHSDYKSMKPYIDIADDVKARQMNKLDTLL